MSAGRETHCLRAKSRHHRASSPPWISKLFVSVWEDEGSAPPGHVAHQAETGVGHHVIQARGHHVWEEEGCPGAGHYGRDSTHWPSNGFDRRIPQPREDSDSNGGYSLLTSSQPARPERAPRQSPSDGQESWGSDSLEECSVGGTPIPFAPGAHVTMAHNSSRHPDRAWFSEDRLPDLHAPSAMSGTLTEPAPSVFHGFEARPTKIVDPAHLNSREHPCGGSLSNNNNYNNTNNNDDSFVSTAKAHSPPNTYLHSPYDAGHEDNRIEGYPDTRSGGDGEFKYQSEGQQSPGNFHHSRSFAADSGVRLKPARYHSHSIHSSAHTKTWQRNPGLYDATRHVRNPERVPTPLSPHSPQPFEMGHHDNRRVTSHYTGYGHHDPRKSRPVSPGRAAGVTTVQHPGFPDRQPYYCEDSLPYPEMNCHPRYAHGSPRYRRPSPAMSECPTSTPCLVPPGYGPKHAGSRSSNFSREDPDTLQPRSDCQRNSPATSSKAAPSRDTSGNRLSQKHTKRNRDDSPEQTKKSEKQPRGAQNLPPCRVCGNKASGLHFGVNTCEACNEFFRRSLKRGANYHCSRNLACKVWGKKRSPCSSCRYRRCLEVGMSRNRIKTGRYSHRTRAEYAQEIERNKRDETFEQEREKVLAMLEALVENHDRYIRNSSHIPREDILKNQERFLATYTANMEQRKQKTSKARDKRDRASVRQDTGRLSDGVQVTSEESIEKPIGNSASSKNDITRDEAQSVCVNDTRNSSTGTSVHTHTRSEAAKDTLDNTKTISKESSDLETMTFATACPLSSGEDHSSGSDTNVESSSGSNGDLRSAGQADTDTDIIDVDADDKNGGEDTASEPIDLDRPTDCMGLTQLDADITERWLRCYITYAKLVPGFKHLPISDQANLVRASWFEFWFLGAHRGFNSDLSVVTYPIGHSLHRSQFTNIFGEEFCTITFHLADRMKTLRLSPEELVLMKTICLLSPDRCELTNRQAVEKMYWALVSALLHILEKNRPKDRTVFPRLGGKLTELRTLTELAMKAHSGALFPDVFQQRPLLGEMTKKTA